MQIARRDVDFVMDPARVPRDWCAGDAYETTFMNALSLLFPEGEKFFVESVKQLKHHVTDPVLTEQVAGFIGQEAMHGREHRAFNDLLVAQGFTRAPKVEARVRRGLDHARRRLSKKSQLAITCALEHFTAILAEQLLASERLRSEFHLEMLPLWLWHALEESEHKAVAFDVYRAAGGGYVHRSLWMLVTTVMFFAGQAAAHVEMMVSRGILFRPWRWLPGLLHMWLWPGYLSRLAPAYLSYFRPGFHPSDRDNRALVTRWRDHLFGADGVLRGQLRAVA